MYSYLVCFTLWAFQHRSISHNHFIKVSWYNIVSIRDTKNALYRRTLYSTTSIICTVAMIALLEFTNLNWTLRWHTVDNGGYNIPLFHAQGDRDMYTPSLVLSQHDTDMCTPSLNSKSGLVSRWQRHVYTIYWNINKCVHHLQFCLNMTETCVYHPWILLKVIETCVHHHLFRC